MRQSSSPLASITGYNRDLVDSLCRESNKLLIADPATLHTVIEILSAATYIENPNKKAWVERWYEELYQLKDLRPILEVVAISIKQGAAEQQPYHILFIEGERTARIWQGSTSVGSFQADHRLMIIGVDHTQRAPTPELIDGIRRGTVIHEFTHWAVGKVYQNNNHPYRTYEEQETYREKVAHQHQTAPRYFTLPEWKVYHEFQEIPLKYPPERWLGEMIVRIPQGIALLKSTRAVKDIIPELLAYHRDVFLPDCKRFIQKQSAGLLLADRERYHHTKDAALSKQNCVIITSSLIDDMINHAQRFYLATQPKGMLSRAYSYFSKSSSQTIANNLKPQLKQALLSIPSETYSGNELRLLQDTLNICFSSLMADNTRSLKTLPSNCQRTAASWRERIDQQRTTKMLNAHTLSLMKNLRHSSTPSFLIDK